MNDLLWFFHIVGICLWFGGTTGVLLVWPSRESMTKPTGSAVDLRTLISLLNRTSHIGAGISALAGVSLSFFVQPKSDLGEFWLEGMQGLGAVAFFLSVVVLSRLGKQVLRTEQTSGQALASVLRYRFWLLVVFVILLICLVLAAFKPVI